MPKLREMGAVLVAPAMLGLSVTAVGAQISMTPSVTVEDQAVDDGANTVTIASVTSDGPGWIVIHADSDGSPGPVIGHEAVADGENTPVVVTIDPEELTPTLWAMLHVDAGEEGIYEFPGDDVPARVDGTIVMSSFDVTSAALTADEASDDASDDAADDEVEATTIAATEEAEATDASEALLPATGGALQLFPVIAALAAGVLLLGSGLALAFRRTKS